MTTNAGMDEEKKNNTYLLLVGAQTGAPSMEISMEIAQRARKRVTMLFSYTILGHMLLLLLLTTLQNFMARHHCLRHNKYKP